MLTVKLASAPADTADGRGMGLILTALLICRCDYSWSHCYTETSSLDHSRCSERYQYFLVTPQGLQLDLQLYPDKKYQNIVFVIANL